MGVFENLTLRSNGEDVDVSWWNSIRSALISTFPSVAVSEVAQTLDNNQTSYVDITGLLLDSLSYTSYKIRYRLQRSDDSPDVRDEVGELQARWDGSAWTFTRTIDYGNALGDGTQDGDFGTDYLYIVPGTGQAQYKSSNMTGGTYVGKLEWRIIEAWGV